MNGRDPLLHQALSDILLQSITTAIPFSQQAKILPPDTCLRDRLSEASPSAAHLVVLTVSAYRFQCLMCMVMVQDCPEPSSDEDQLKELANNLCGTFKRHLGQFVTVLGLSTPNLLPLNCLPYLQPSVVAPIQSSVYCRDEQGNSVYVALLIPENIAASDLNIPEMFTTHDLESNVGELELF